MSQFELKTQAPSEAIVRLQLAKTDNVEKFGGRIWHKERADGRYSVIGNSQQVSNVFLRGLELKQEKICDASVDVRLTPDDMSSLLEDLEEIEGRVAEIHILMDKEPTVGMLTLANGSNARSIVFYGTLAGVRAGSSALTSDEFASQEELDEFLSGAANDARTKRQSYREEMQAARMAAPVQEGVKDNILA